MHFYKYQGTGNDFIVVDDRSQEFDLHQGQIAALCERRKGIGADGLMLLQKAQDYDFRMVYFNADGSEGSMCGNGGRCLVRFAADLGIVKEEAYFIAIDGPHQARIFPDRISLKMQDVDNIEPKGAQAYYTNTGSPHWVQFESELQSLDVKQLGAAIRYSEAFATQNGTNVNFTRCISPNLLEVRTYERGVEDETHSCGTGVTAAALVAAMTQGYHSPIEIQTKGGQLFVSFQGNAQSGFSDIHLIGPAEFVFKGQIDIH